MNIILLGIQGSGKGSLVEYLKKELDFTLISTGELLRQEAKSGSVLGEQIKDAQMRGELVDNNITLGVIKKKLKSVKGLVMFDGFPRNLAQAEAFDKELKADIVLNLNLSKEVAMDRILNRLTCSQCGHITSRSEVYSMVCPMCNGELKQRADDTPESIEVRFKTFYEQTSPLVERYKEQGVLYDINANQTPEKVFEDALKVIKNVCNN